ncbi:SpaA isopeptide-forming pilin-related protein [Anaerotruncus colihominis]|uniref:SpaA-like prealbumin fold domain-containing protein n=4 Tax=Bacteria TaxID=2 RepID=A0A845SXL4_9FIRM|nr:SpaA isopeptide-forming pilin-related protein [Anaerotruncus colihominis]MCR2026592.1 SpaA isopeptide-forming pilin-related protein [Anaerotruncus colihominis]NDO39012.1 hypothetical protein [Anaerotruncus colihominis]
MKKFHFPRTRLIAALLALVCVLGLLPGTALAATPDTIKMDDCTHNGVKYESPALGTCHLHQMHFGLNGKSTMGFCAEKGKGMGWSLEGHTWGSPKPVNDPTVKTMMAYFYAHSTGVFTDQAKALGVDDVWDSNYAWTMNSWTQAIVWRYKAGLLSDPVVACAEELLCVYNNLEHTNYSSIDETMDGRSFRDRAQYILDLGAQGVWGECEVYEYAYTGPGSSYHPSNDVQAVMVGELNVTREKYSLTVKKVDSTNPNKTLPGARFLVASENGSYSKEVVTGSDGTVTVPNLEAGTYAVTELEAPEGYEIDNPGPQYVVLPSGSDKTVTVTFTDTPEITGEGSIRKVDADDPTRGLAGAVIKIEGVDNDFTGTYVTGAGGYLTDVPWKDMPLGSYTAEEVTPPEGYTKSPDVNKTKQTFVWDGKTDVALVFENDAKVKVRLIKKDDSDNPLPGAVFNIVKDGQIIGTEATKADGSITVTDVTEGMYAFVEVSVPAPWATLTEPVIAHVDQATVNGGGTVTVTASDKRLPNLTILKRDAQTGDVIPNTHFEIRGIHYGYHNDVTTGPDGRAVLSNIPVDSYEVTEKSVPDPYVVGDEPTQTIWLGAGDSKELVFDNLKQPVLKISKVEQGSNTPIPGTVFTVEGIDSDYRQDVTTEADGFVTLRVAPGSYRVTEKSVPEPYCLPEDEAGRTQTISLNGGDEKTLIFKNSKKPLLTLSKIDADTGVPVPGTVLTVEGIDSDYKDDWRTGPDGTVALRVDPGTYRITEKSVPAPYYLPDKDADRVQTISLNPGDEKTVVFRNHKTPELTIFKEDSVAGAPIEGAKFRVTYTSNGEAAGAPASMDFGIFVTDASGQIKLHEKGKKLYPGEYTVTEVEPAPGFQMKEPLTQKVILHGGESKTLTFFNEPLNAIVVEKYDSVTHEALPGCTFQLRFLGGTSGTGGTVIGTKVTGKNGTAIWTGLTAGTYIVEEIDPADGYSIINASETVYISDKGEQNVVTVSFDNAPDGILLIRKVCATNPSVTLQNAEFKIMYADGTLIGDSNGIFRTDENGEIRIPGLKPGKSVVVTEVRAPAGFILDTQSQTIQIQAGKTVSLTFKNQPKGSLIIQKRDSQTDEVLPGAEFRITTAAGCEVGLDGVIGSSTLTQNGIFTTDAQGEIRITNLAPGAYVINEIKAPDGGYVIDTPSTNVVIGQGGDTQTVVIKNTRKGGLIIEKYDSVTRQPLAGAQFKVMTANGELTPDNEGMTSSNGLYTTDVNGQIVLSKLLPGTYVVSEEKAPDNYRKDPTPQMVVVNAGDTQTLRFYDDPLCTLTILKRDAVTKKPLRGAEFMVRDSSGHVIGPNNGLYTTGTDGTVTVTGLAPNSTVVVSEKKAPNGYILDETPKNTVVRTGVANTLIFDDEPGTTLIIRKFIEGTENEPLSGVAFKVVDGNGGAVGPDDGIYYTDKAGEIVLEGIEPGTTVKVREIKTVEGFVLDGTPQDILIKGGEAQQLTFWNKRAGTLVIQKKDSVSGALISGAQFQLTYANGGYVDNDNGHLSSNGLYTTDDKGEIRINGVTGTVVVKETKPAPGYVIDQSTQTQTVTVNPLDTQTLTFLNEPLCSLTLTKLDSVTGKPVPGTEFTVKDGNGTILGRYTTGKDGTVVVTGLVPGSTVVVSETKVPYGYVLDTTPKTIIVKNGSNTVNSGGTTGGNTGGSTNTGNGNDLTFENDPTVNLTIRKYIEGTANEPLAGVAFKITDGSGAPVGPGDGVFYTNAAGEIVVENLEPGTTITAREIKTVDGYVLDGTPKSVKITAGPQAPELIFWNKKAGTLVIQKKDSVTGALIPGAQFQLTYANGGYVDNDNGHLSSNGLYTTDDKGEIRISGITGTVVVKETKPAPGYVIDQSTQTQTVTVNPLDTQTLTFLNEPLCSLTLTKLDSVTGKPIPGTEFTVKDGNGTVLGRYTTGKDGTVVVTGLVPGSTVVVTETKVPDGYVLNPTPQTIIVKNGSNSVNSGTVGGTTNGNTGGSTNVGGGTNGGNDLVFENDPIGTFELIKVVEGNKEKRIPNVTFEIRRASDDALVETVTTGSDGRVSLKLDAGDYYAVETEAAKGFKLDATRHYFTMKNGKNTTLTVENKPFSGILIHKTNSVTGKGIQGVTFLLYDSANAPIGQYTSDNSGYVYIENLTVSGRYYLRELENEGYVPDTQMKTVYVTAGETTLVEWKNIPITAQIQIVKKSADYNSTNGLPAGTPLEGAVFEIYDKAGNLVDTIKSDQRGLASSKPLPLGRYTIRETKAPANYGVSDTELTAYLEHEGQILRFEVTNKSLTTGVSITKTGPREAMAGQPVNYVLSGIANNSNVMLQSFYWRDTLPAQVRLNTIVTGTYNFPGVYKITYRVNGGEYRTLADNLSTSRNYTLQASPAALGLAANERVTEVMFVFGQAPAGFAQVEKPQIKCTAVAGLTAGSSFVNIADVGGVYNGVWVQAISRWVTTVYGKPTPLPKTGY